MNIRENAPIKELTTMRLGGAARYVVEVETADDVASAYAFAAEKNLPVFVLGGGANTIGRDEGFPGVILLCRIPEIQFFDPADEAGKTPITDLANFSGDKIWLRAGAGEIWDDVCAAASDAGFTGIEAMSLIPGTVGAAPVQNIGAYGQELKFVMKSLTAYDTQKQEMVTLETPALNFGYRRSILNHEEKGRYFVVDITLELAKGQLQPPFYPSLQGYVDEHQITDFSPAAIREAVVAVRRGKLPDPEEEASAGSFFKNIYFEDEAAAEAARAKGIPVFGEYGTYSISSGWLIEHTGLKGQLFHGMRVYPTAALVLVNESAQSYADLAAAREEIRQAVLEKFGYELTQEPEELVVETA